jgi:hypothetical protein
MKTIPSDELTALATAATIWPHSAKTHIRQAWATGDYYKFTAHGIDASALQRFRNSSHGGPSGLTRLNLKKLIREAGI